MTQPGDLSSAGPGESDVETDRRPAPAARKRGRETAWDMIRSLALVMVLVVVAFVLAQPPDSDKAEIRPIDPVADLRSFGRAVPGAVVPGTLPAEWVPTVSVYASAPDRVRVGYVTPRKQYAEFAASIGDRTEFLLEATGESRVQGDAVTVGGATYEQRVTDDGAISLVRQVGATTVVVGGVRATTALDELRVLAGSLVVTAVATSG